METNKPKRWTEEEEARLKQLYSQKYTISVIAERLHRSKRAVAMRLEKLGLSVNAYILRKEIDENAYNPWTEEEEKIIRVLYKNGKTPTEIGEYVKRSGHAVYVRLVDMKLIKKD